MHCSSESGSNVNYRYIIIISITNVMFFYIKSRYNFITDFAEGRLFSLSGSQIKLKFKIITLLLKMVLTFIT